MLQVQFGGWRTVLSLQFPVHYHRGTGIQGSYGEAAAFPFRSADARTGVLTQGPSAGMSVGGWRSPSASV